jgi:hypothetical protein
VGGGLREGPLDHPAQRCPSDEVAEEDVGVVDVVGEAVEDGVRVATVVSGQEPVHQWRWGGRHAPRLNPEVG